MRYFTSLLVLFTFTEQSFAAYVSKNPAVTSVILDDLGVTTPANPASSEYKLIVRSGAVFLRNSSGTEVAIGGGTSGTYTPTASNLSGVDAVTSLAANYQQIGNMVFVTGVASVDMTAANTPGNFDITLPVARSGNFTNSGGPASGVAGSEVNGVSHGTNSFNLYPNNGTQRITFTGALGTGSATTVNFLFMYTLT